MQLILAIEPDRRQATQISTMVREHLDAELVIAGSTQRAFKTLGERVPDLILTPALLAPADEAMLAERLRELGPAATHIQTVTIPILSETAESGRYRGVLGLRRERQAEATDAGCELTVFVNQVAAYLQRAAQERLTSAMLNARSTDAAPPAELVVEEHRVEDPAPAPISELAEWLDFDEMMATIADDSPSTRPAAPSLEPQEFLTSVAQRANILPTAFDQPVSASPAFAIGESRPSWTEPADDEGIIFDPHQRAFPALIARLNAIANADDANRPR